MDESPPLDNDFLPLQKGSSKIVDQTVHESGYYDLGDTPHIYQLITACTIGSGQTPAHNRTTSSDFNELKRRTSHASTTCFYLTPSDSPVVRIPDR